MNSKKKVHKKLTESVSSILYVILFTVSPTLLNNLITPALLKADVLVAFGSSTSLIIKILRNSNSKERFM